MRETPNDGTVAECSPLQAAQIHEHIPLKLVEVLDENRATFRPVSTVFPEFTSRWLPMPPYDCRMSRRSRNRRGPSQARKPDGEDNEPRATIPTMGAAFVSERPRSEALTEDEKRAREATLLGSKTNRRLAPLE
jgi:hypothetical protein